MIVISYDISDDKLRTKFSKYLEKYGNRMQYSVFQIQNSDRILTNIAQDIENKFSKKFNQQDSVYIFIMDSRTEIKRYGYAKNEEKDIIVI